jgi:hypothetical protein
LSEKSASGSRQMISAYVISLIMLFIQTMVQFTSTFRYMDQNQ